MRAERKKAQTGHSWIELKKYTERFYVTNVRSETASELRLYLVSVTGLPAPLPLVDRTDVPKVF